MYPVEAYRGVLEAVIAIRDHHRETGCWPDVRTVARRLGCSVQVAHARMQKAFFAGLLVREGDLHSRAPYTLPLGDPCPSCGQRVPAEPGTRDHLVTPVDPARSA
jgi:hypothetical protein